MAKIETSIVINRPIEQVFAFAADSNHNPQWQWSTAESRRTPDGPIGVGSKVMEVHQFQAGLRLEWAYEVTEYEPNKKFSVQSISSGPVQFKGTSTLESVANGTKITIAIEIESGGFFTLAEPFFGNAAKRNAEASFAKLKEVLEAQS